MSFNKVQECLNKVALKSSQLTSVLVISLSKEKWSITQSIEPEDAAQMTVLIMGLYKALTGDTNDHLHKLAKIIVANGTAGEQSRDPQS